MNLLPLLAGLAPGRHARTLALAALALAAGLSAPASLIFYMPQGGPREYTYVGPVAAQFTLQEATRILGVSAWVTGSADYPSSISIRYDLPEDYPDPYSIYSSPYQLTAAHNAPAIWQGISSLEWDLQPGTYWLVFDGFGSYPLGYGYSGPRPVVAETTAEITALANRWGFDGPWESPAYPFGLKVYATPLSAVPEPATFGMFAALGLGVFTWRRRWNSRSAA